jgi:hypothetical protein
LTNYLDISREIEIVNNLAFLLAILDNTLKAMAMCVKERFNGGIAI